MTKTKPLTKPDIDRAKPQAKRFIIWDGSFPGFGVRIEPSGKKTFFLRYRADGGGRTARQRTMTIGQYGILTLHEARMQARQILASVVTGADPAKDLKTARNEMRVVDLIDLYEEEGCFVQRGKRQGEPMKPKSKKYTISRLRNHVVPLLGNKRIGKINAGDIEKFVRDVAAGKTRKDEKTGLRTRIIVRGGEGAARKVVRDLSAVFNFAIRRELMESNPVMRASIRKTDNDRTRFLSLEEMQFLGRTFETLLDQGANPKAIKIAKLWALTGCRRDEIAGLKWDEVDLEPLTCPLRSDPF